MSEITVSLDDLALVLYLPKLTVDEDTLPRTCQACGQPCGAHYCAPRQEARWRLERQVALALDKKLHNPATDI